MEGGHLITVRETISWEIVHGRFDYQKFGLLDNTHARFLTRKV